MFVAGKYQATNCLHTVLARVATNLVHCIVWILRRHSVRARNLAGLHNYKNVCIYVCIIRARTRVARTMYWRRSITIVL